MGCALSAGSCDIGGPSVTGGGGGTDLGGGGGLGGGIGGGTGGGVGTGGGFVGDAGLPEKMACTTLNAKRCDFYARCGLIDSTDSARRDCLAYLQATWCGPAKWPSQVEAGTLTYNALTAQTCADSFDTRACNDYSALPAACDAITSPNAGNGQACYDGYDECSDGVCRGAACPRTCQPRGDVGEVCQVDTDCKTSLYCRLSTQATGSGTCQNFGMVMDLCSSVEPCGIGLRCVASHCIQLPTLGDPCPNSLCDDTSFCQVTLDGGICAPRVGQGEACTDDLRCLPDFLCQQMVCVPRVIAMTGTECSDRQTCPAGTVCVGASTMQLGHCLSPLQQDQPCVSSDDCETQLACRSADGGLELSCGPRIANGGSCTVNRDCELYSICVTGLCTRLPYTGQDCTVTQQCLFGPCVNTGDAGWVCNDRFGPGVQCSRDEDCASMRCLAGSCLPTCAP
jgi:hypothetical protein